MMLNLAVVVLILLITLYLATQGMLSSLLALATAIFSSVLAMALLEPLQGIIGGWRPDFARGVTFLLLFFLTFSATRILADIAVPKTIKLSLLVNRIAGGFVGFFTGLVVVGTLLIGIEMLPVSRKPMGFDRFPGATHMQAVDENGVPKLGEVAKMQNVLSFVRPDRFVLAIWNGTSGRSLGGGRAFGTVHPDLSIESYGYRNQVDGSLRTLPGDLMQVRDAAWLAPETKYRYPEGATAVEYPTGDKRLFMVRTEVSKGEKAGHTSDNYSGTEPYFYISASQVRLITEKGRQYFPIGYLELGQRFQGLSLDTGYVVDDYVKEKIVDDWVFQLPADEKPVAIEMKQLARADLTKVSDKPVQLAANYPPHGYFKDLCTLKVVFDPKPPRGLKAGHVYVLTQDIRRSDISTTHITNAHNHVIDCDKDMQKGANGWTDAGGPGVPGASMLRYAENTGVKMLADLDDATVEWSGLTALLLLGQVESNGTHNLLQVPAYFDSSFVSMLREGKRGNMIVGQADADPKGSADIERISPGKHVVIFSETVAKEGADRAFFVWVKEMDFGGKGKNNITSITLSESSGDSPIFKLDLDEKVP